LTTRLNNACKCSGRFYAPPGIEAAPLSRFTHTVCSRGSRLSVVVVDVVVLFVRLASEYDKQHNYITCEASKIEGNLRQVEEQFLTAIIGYDISAIARKKHITWTRIDPISVCIYFFLNYYRYFRQGSYVLALPIFMQKTQKVMNRF